MSTESSVAGEEPAELSTPLRDHVVRAVRHAVLLVWLVAVLFPIYWIVSLSLKPPRAAISLPPDWVFLPTVFNYIQLFQNESFIDGFVNSSIIVVSSVLVAIVVGVPGAYVLSRYDVPRKRDILIWILSSRMLPPIAVVIPYFVLFQRFDLYDTYVGLMFMYVTINISLVVWVMKAFFDGIPQSLEEAARVDGATRTQAFLRIILPSARNGVISVAIISFIFAWNELLFSLILTNQRAVTATMQVYQFIGVRKIEWGMLAAASTSIMLPILIFLVLVNRYLASGLSFGIVLKE